MSLDHDIPTHLDVADRPALGLTVPQLLALAGGLLAGLGVLRAPHLPLALRLAEGLAPLILCFALVFVRPAGRSLLTWARVAVRHLTGSRIFSWAGSGDVAPRAALDRPARPPHLSVIGQRADAAVAAPSSSWQRVRHAATSRRPFVPWTITDDVVTFRDGRHCAMLECVAVNTALMDEAALRAIHAAYHAFLVGLPWPLQLLVWASPVDLRPHTAARDARLGTLPLGLRELESADTAFMRREARRLGLLEQRLFVVIPAPDRAGRTVPTASLLAALQKQFHPAQAYSDNDVTALLDERCERVATALATVGIHAWRLSTMALQSLWYRLLAPHTAAVQPFDEGHAVSMARPEITFGHLPLHREDDADA